MNNSELEEYLVRLKSWQESVVEAYENVLILGGAGSGPEMDKIRNAAWDKLDKLMMSASDIKAIKSV